MNQKIYFTNSNGLKLCGILSNPTDDVAKPIMILCHGFTTGKHSTTYVKLEELLNAKGIATFRFDFFGHGESEGKFEDITISEAADDILRAIEYLEGLGYSKMGLFGSSFGGAASIIAASKTKDLSLLVLKSPVADYMEREMGKGNKKELGEWKEKGFKDYFDSKGNKYKLNYTFFEDFAKNDGYEAAKKIIIPVLIVHGDADTSVPIEQSKKLRKTLANAKLEIIKGANHHYSDPEHYQKHLDLVMNFIVENI
ncbi:MAG: alpha/beta fold hydrolase [Candidatus Moranbacteria bacterium]|nr:alpha/beta fold hydrolase [Candidatus Moranbacteria bacterium]